MKQNTLKDTVSFQGQGLHSGKATQMNIRPAPAGYGIKFIRIDQSLTSIIEAQAGNITKTELCTTLGNGSESISTIEHLMAAFLGLGIDNAMVEIDATEIPIMDGSALPFAEGFLKVGLEELDQPRKSLVVKKTFEFHDDDRSVKIEPSDHPSYQCSIDFGKGFIGRQSIDFKLTQENFLELANARTFCHINEVNYLKSVGLALGGSLENAVVVTDDGVMNEEGLRNKDEFVRHKLLDCIGDLFLLGAPIIGRITVIKPGHGLHAKFMQEVLNRKDELFTVV